MQASTFSAGLPFDERQMNRQLFYTKTMTESHVTGLNFDFALTLTLTLTERDVVSESRLDLRAHFFIIF